MAKAKDSYASEFARKGGKARARKLSSEQRQQSARKAAQARWARVRKVDKDESSTSDASKG
jgi:hypothetical protein